MSITVRAIMSSDFEAVTTLLAELGRPAMTQETQRQLRDVFHAHVAREDTHSLVAEHQGQIVGFMSLEFRARLNHPRPEAWIPDLIVTEQARGLKAGKALLQKGVALARERGCHRITLESGYARTVAHQFYEMQGMTNAGYYFTVEV